jgi:hypothetical protein
MHQGDGDVTNADRALFVAPLVELFTTAYYHGPEDIGTVVQDMISDLCHYMDSIDDRELNNRVAAEVASDAVDMYVIEKEEAAQELLDDEE